MPETKKPKKDGDLLPVMGIAVAVALGALYLASSGRAVPVDESLWMRSHGEALERAQVEGKLVFMDVYADWCGPCRRMDANTFTNARVRERLDDFVPLKIDADVEVDVARRYNAQYLPSLYVLDGSGKVLAQASGFMGARDLLRFLDAVEIGDVRR